MIEHLKNRKLSITVYLFFTVALSLLLIILASRHIIEPNNNFEMENDQMNFLLITARMHIKNLLQFEHVLVVLGNETCDLDSAISSLVYSLLLHHRKKSDSTIVIPVFNIPRVHLPIKTEVTYLLKKYNINLDNVVCRDEIDLTALQDKGSLHLTLVDHHVLQPSDRHLATSVVGVVDHRPPDPEWPWPNADVTLRIVGSCCTLVAEKLLTQASELVTSVTATLLLGTILLDTNCLSPASGKATAPDHQVAEQLQARMTQPVDREQLCTELRTAKTDVSSLTAAQLLVKDLKVVEGIPIAGLPMKVKEFLKLSDASSAMQQFCEEQKTQVCVIYGSGLKNGASKKDLAVYSHSRKDAANQIIAALTDSKDPFLDLRPHDCSVQGFTLFDQFNTKASRKQFLPLIRQVGAKLQST